MLHGPILTQADTLDQVRDCIRRGGYNALKVVTGWGLPTGWTREAMIAVSQMVPNLVVRTVAGDPSYNKGAKALPDSNQVIGELMPWYIARFAVQPTIVFELGNEPNIKPDWSEQFCWDYRWHLNMAIASCRAAFPRARLIAPAIILDADKRPQRWLEICADVMAACDYIGLHAYEHDAWLQSERRHGTTGQLARGLDLYARFFPGRPIMLTEYGIHDPATSDAIKGARYANMLRRRASTPALPATVQGALWYHLCVKGDIQPEYDISGAGDLAYRKAWEAT